jgi:hypothetical protein
MFHANLLHASDGLLLAAFAHSIPQYASSCSVLHLCIPLQPPLHNLHYQAILIEDDYQYQQQQQQPARRLSFNGSSLGGSAGSAFTPVTPSSPYLYNRNSSSSFSHSTAGGVSSPTAFAPPLRSSCRARSFSTSCASPAFASGARRRSSTGLLLSETLSPLSQQQQQLQPLHHTPQHLLQQQQQQQRVHSPYAVSPAGGFNSSSSDRLPENQDMLCSAADNSSSSNSAGSGYRYAQQQQQRLLDGSSVMQRTSSYTSSGPSSPW